MTRHYLVNDTLGYAWTSQDVTYIPEGVREVDYKTFRAARTEQERNRYASWLVTLTPAEAEKMRRYAKKHGLKTPQAALQLVASAIIAKLDA